MELQWDEETETYVEVEVETALYIYVSERGNVQRFYQAWNGGGRGDGSFTGGGGATDIRWSGEEDSITWGSNIADRFIVAGAGGGSNFCLSANIESYNMLMNVIDTVQVPDWFPLGQWVGLDINASMNTSPWLYDVNTYHLMGYEKWRNALGEGYGDYLEFRNGVS